MSQPLNVAVVGATGSVGEALVGLLDERDFPLHRLHLLASAESAGQRMGFAESSLRVGDVDSFDFSSVGLAFFAAAAEVSRAHAEARPRGGLFGDRPERRPGTERRTAGHGFGECRTPGLPSGAVPLSSPCAVAAELCEVLAPLLATLDCRQLNLTACLSVSSLGREGVKELARQTAELLNARPWSRVSSTARSPSTCSRRSERWMPRTQRDRAAHLRGGAGLAWRAYRTVERYLHPGAGILRR